MIERLTLVGIGTGNPGHVTLEGVEALRAAGLILVPHKGADKADLAAIRLRILGAAGAGGQVVGFDYPRRDPALAYAARVDAWHDEIARRWQQAAARVPHAGAVALLVWGDPAFYDSTLRIAARLTPPPAIRVVPGITAVQALTAAHAIPLNDINGRILTTTGRRLRAEGWPAGAETLVVVLDGEAGFQHLDVPDLRIWWGAYLGMPEQILAEGRLPEATPRILALRAAARARHGWLMDTYLLRRG